MPLDRATPGKWKSEHGMVVSTSPERTVFVAMVELPSSRSRDAKEVLQEQDANAALMAHSKQMYFLLERVADYLDRQETPEWSLMEDVRLLKQSVKASVD